MVCEEMINIMKGKNQINDLAQTCGNPFHMQPNIQIKFPIRPHIPIMGTLGGSDPLSNQAQIPCYHISSVSHQPWADPSIVWGIFCVKQISVFKQFLT